MTLNKHQFSGYLFHGTNAADEIMQDKRVESSGENTIAGTSGIFTSTRPSGARAWGSDVVALKTNRPLNIYPDINEDPELAQMRRQKQFADEYFSGEPDLEEYYGPEHGDTFPLTEESARKAKDVSQHLSEKGYHGHIDSLAVGTPQEKHIVVYDPEDLTVVKKLKNR